MRAASPFVLVITAFAFAWGGCNDAEDPPPPAASPAVTPSVSSITTPEAATPSSDTAAAPSAPPEVPAGADTDAAEPGATEDAAPTEGTPPADKAAFMGPCNVRWSNGAALHFAYTGQGGSVRLDEDRDGTPDVCATFDLAESRVARLGIEPGCKGDSGYSIEPEYDPKANVASATFTERERKKAVKRSITIVTLPSFVGLEPGYVLYAKRAALKLTIRGGLVRTARVPKPFAGDPLEAKFTYDAAGRIKTITEDLALDGTVDRRLDYAYDSSGRVTRMEVTLGQGTDAQKSSARVDYDGCSPS